MPLATGTRHARLAWIAGTLAIAAATGAVAWWIARPAPGADRPFHVALPAMVDASMDDPAVAIAPDGRHVVYVTADGVSLVLRDLESGQARVLSEGRRVTGPIFSPDSQQIAYVASPAGSTRPGASSSLERVAIGGGAPTKIVDGIAGLRGASWGDDGSIYYAPGPASGLWRVRAEGGTPEALTKPDLAKGEKTHRWPFVLPGGQAVLFVVGTSRMTSYDDARIEILSLADRARHPLIEGGTAPQYIKTLNLLTYLRKGSLVAQPFDLKTLQLRGTAFTAAESVCDETVSGAGRYGISANGTLIAMPQSPEPKAQILTIDRQGRGTPVAQAPAWIVGGALSPDGTKVAVAVDGPTQQIAIIDLEGNGTARFTAEWDNATPIWTANGHRLIFVSNTGGGARNIFWQPVDGSSGVERLTTSEEDQVPDSLSDRQLVFESTSPKTSTDLWTLSLGDRSPQVLLQTPFNETAARFSPNGDWLAYQSDQSGQPEIFVQAMPYSGQRWQISSGGGTRPMWLSEGRQIAYLHGLDVMSVTVTLGPAMSMGMPSKVFTLTTGDRLLDVTRDGRFMIVRQDRPTSQPPNIVLNWFTELRRLAGGR